MANRPVFFPSQSSNSYRSSSLINFSWYAGFSVIQKRKCINALHEAAKKQGKIPILEISTKSNNSIGVRASAFNLRFVSGQKAGASVESVYQGSKVFQNGGPYTDLYRISSGGAKKDARIRDGYRLMRFECDGEEWPLQPKTLFYDWLYLRALCDNPTVASELGRYSGFTDIEFNPRKGVSCQAASAALYVALVRRGDFQKVIASKAAFIEAMCSVDQRDLFIE